MDGKDLSEESYGGRCGAAGGVDDIRNRKLTRRRWWKRFSPSAVCNQKQNKNREECSEKQTNDSGVPPEVVLQEAGTSALDTKEEESADGAKGKRRFNVRTWSTFKRFQTSFKVRQTHEEKTDDEPSRSLGKKVRMFFSRRRRNRLSGVRLENMENTTLCEEAPCSPVAQVEEPSELHDNVADDSVEVVTVAAEMSVQLTEQTAADPQVCDISDDVNRSEPIQNDSEAVGDTNVVPVEDLMEAAEKDKVSCDTATVVLDADDYPSSSTTSSQQASKLPCEEKTTSHCLQPTTNGPSIRIELVPRYDISQDDDEEECWEDFSSDNHNLLLLFDFEHSERQLHQMARCLVRAAMTAAVDQLTREQQSDSGCVHREPPGCRDHAWRRGTTVRRGGRTWGG